MKKLTLLWEHGQLGVRRSEEGRKGCKGDWKNIRRKRIEWADQLLWGMEGEGRKEGRKKKAAEGVNVNKG